MANTMTLPPNTHATDVGRPGLLSEISEAVIGGIWVLVTKRDGLAIEAKTSDDIVLQGVAEIEAGQIVYASVAEIEAYDDE